MIFNANLEQFDRLCQERLPSSYAFEFPLSFLDTYHGGAKNEGLTYDYLPLYDIK